MTMTDIDHALSRLEASVRALREGLAEIAERLTAAAT